MFIWFRFRFRASSWLSIVATLLSNFSRKFANYPITEFSAWPVSTALTVLDLDDQLSSLFFSVAAAFAKIKTSPLTLPDFKYGLISLSAYGLVMSFSRVLMKNYWTKLGSYVMSSDWLDATMTLWRISRQQITKWYAVLSESRAIYVTWLHKSGAFPLPSGLVKILIKCQGLSLPPFPIYFPGED